MRVRNCENKREDFIVLVVGRGWGFWKMWRARFALDFFNSL